MDASSGLVLTLQFVVVSCHSLGASYRLVARLRLGSTGGHERSGLGGVYLSRCLSWAPHGMGGLWASSKTKGWWPGSRWGWGEYGVLTGPRSISPSLKKGMTRIDTIRQSVSSHSPEVSKRSEGVVCTCGASEAKRHAAQHATRIFTAHAHLSASTFLLSRHPPQCAAVEAKKFSVRAVEASHCEAFCGSKCNFLGSFTMAAVAAVQLWSTTAVAWVVRLCANVDGCPFHFVCVSKSLASWQNTRCSKGAHPKHPSEVGSRRACDASQGGYRLEMPLPACDLSC